ncbi:MAG: hypothetical protein RIS44_2938 [Pseudomonadota bacterium]|jgi:fucose 4-O-acetylase-like acetyltransferase
MRMLAMLLVVAGHSDWLFRSHPEAHRFIYLFHMPVFFFASGCVFKYKSIPALVANRAERLLLPYATVSIMATVYYLYTKRPFSVDEPWSGLLWATGYSIPWTPLWFLPALFLATVGHGVLASVQKKKQLGLWFLTTSIALLLLTQWIFLDLYRQDPLLNNTGRPLGWPWSLDMLPICMAYFALGALCSSPRLRALALQASDRLHVLPFLASLGVFIMLFNAGASLDLNHRRFQPFAGVVVASISGILLLLLASKVLAGSARLSVWAAAFSEKIMLIFLLHSPIQAAVLRALPSDRLSSAAVAYVVAILVPMLLHTVLIKRWPLANFLLGGGRRPLRQLSPA